MCHSVPVHLSSKTLPSAGFQQNTLSVLNLAVSSLARRNLYEELFMMA